jgi:hypothetical protein
VALNLLNEAFQNSPLDGAGIDVFKASIRWRWCQSVLKAAKLWRGCRFFKNPPDSVGVAIF